jgi:Rrf2 family protein
MGIPPRFVPHVLGDLGRAGLVEATSGKRGGYRVAAAVERLSLLEVIEALEGPTGAPLDGSGDGAIGDEAPCLPGDPCNVERALVGARQAFVGVLAGASFADLVGRPPVSADAVEGRISPERNIA